MLEARCPLVEAVIVDSNYFIAEYLPYCAHWLLNTAHC